jgi:hypothetical protein
MNIQALKQQIATKAGIQLPTLMLSRQKNEEGEEQPWLSHWDNDKRVRITMHDDVANKVKAEPAFDGLAFKEELVAATPERATYTRFVVITPTSVVMTF